MVASRAPIPGPSLAWILGAVVWPVALWLFPTATWAADRVRVVGLGAWLGALSSGVAGFALRGRDRGPNAVRALRALLLADTGVLLGGAVFFACRWWELVVVPAMGV